jgi:hypothetical protein
MPIKRTTQPGIAGKSVIQNPKSKIQNNITMGIAKFSE